MQTNLNDTIHQWWKEDAAGTFVGPHQSVEKTKMTGEKLRVASVSRSFSTGLHLLRPVSYIDVASAQCT